MLINTWAFLMCGRSELLILIIFWHAINLYLVEGCCRTSGNHNLCRELIFCWIWHELHHHRVIMEQTTVMSGPLSSQSCHGEKHSGVKLLVIICMLNRLTSQALYRFFTATQIGKWSSSQDDACHRPMLKETTKKWQMGKFSSLNTRDNCWVTLVASVTCRGCSTLCKILLYRPHIYRTLYQLY